MQTRQTLLCAALAAMISHTASAQTHEVIVENLAGPGGVFLTPVWIGFHAGDFDLYDRGAPSSPELERLAEDGDVDPLDQLFRSVATRVSVTVTEPSGFPGAPVFDPGTVGRATVELDPARHRYLSYASMVIPSNDAFVANGNPTAHQLFDDQGQSTGAVSFVVYGRDVLDAGTEANTETDAAFFNQSGPNQGTPENGVVTLHSGFNGSIANPAGQPVNILGGSFMGITFDPLAADFTQSFYPLMRVTLRPLHETVRVRVRNLQPEGGLFFTPFWVGFHDGSFDLYDRGAPASPGLESLAEDGDTALLSDAFAGFGVDGTIVEPSGFAGAPVFDPGTVAEQLFDVEPGAQRYFSYASMAIPSNDAFIANGEPRQFSVFDAEGRFTPVHFRVTGGMVLDAGTEVNTEQDAAFLNQSGPNQGDDENGVVQLHPGFNGSMRLPNGSPINILGGTNAAGAFIDPQIADFTRANPNLVEISVTRLVDASHSGAWYNPERAGEGFLLDITERDGQLIGVLSGYTYTADGSGNQVWIFGDGPVIGDTLVAELLTADGGTFLSTDNPVQVIKQPFGNVRLRFVDCATAELTMNATQQGFQSNSTIPLTRLTAPAVGTIAACSK